MKHRFLVVYDYGMGGVWGFINARSREEIAAKYPKVQIIDERPTWMSDEYFDSILKTSEFDIDDLPSGWLAKLDD